MLMRTLKFIRGQQKKSIIISSGNYPNILFPGTLPKNLRILQDCIWPFCNSLAIILFIQDTRKSTYELLHTKPVTAIQYICGKVISGFISMLGVLVILNVIFFMLCLKTSLESGFPVTPIDFCVNSLIYIVPNLLMICCVYTITALIFKNPLPAAPILFLHIIYSNMLTMKNDIYYMRPFSIMVRFPGRFFETHVAKMSNINQIILVISSVILVCISVTIWKRRRVH